MNPQRTLITLPRLLCASLFAPSLPSSPTRAKVVCPSGAAKPHDRHHQERRRHCSRWRRQQQQQQPPSSRGRPQSGSADRLPGRPQQLLPSRSIRLSSRHQVTTPSSVVSVVYVFYFSVYPLTYHPLSGINYCVELTGISRGS